MAEALAELHPDVASVKNEALAELHPDVASVKKIFGRDQHYVDYRPFKNNELVPRVNISEIPDTPNEYGMILVDISK